MYDGGIRSPLIAWWPGKVPAGRVDTSSYFAFWDLMPTFADIAGINTGGGWKITKEGGERREREEEERSNQSNRHPTKQVACEYRWLVEVGYSARSNSAQSWLLILWGMSFLHFFSILLSSLFLSLFLFFFSLCSLITFFLVLLQWKLPQLLWEPETGKVSPPPLPLSPSLSSFSSPPLVSLFYILFCLFDFLLIMIQEWDGAWIAQLNCTTSVQTLESKTILPGTSPSSPPLPPFLLFCSLFFLSLSLLLILTYQRPSLCGDRLGHHLQRCPRREQSVPFKPMQPWMLGRKRRGETRQDEKRQERKGRGKKRE